MEKRLGEKNGFSWVSILLSVLLGLLLTTVVDLMMPLLFLYGINEYIEIPAIGLFRVIYWKNFLIPVFLPLLSAVFYCFYYF